MGDRRAELARLLTRRAARGERAAASFAQERVWFLEQWHPGTAAFHMAVAVRLSGPLDARKVQRSLHDLVARHDSLRTTFDVRDGRPVQVIAPPGAVPLPVVDLSARAEMDREDALRDAIAVEARRPFDLAAGPLFRAVLFRVGADEHVLFVNVHHIVSDGWSMDIVVREWMDLYRARAEGRAAALPDIPVRYADYAAWQRGAIEGGGLEAELAPWRARLAGCAVLELPADRPRPPVAGTDGAREHRALSPALTAAVKSLAQREGRTLFVTLLAAFKVLLARYTGQDDVVVGTPIAGRTRAELEGVIGLFADVLPLRDDLSGAPSFRELAARVHATVVAAQAHAAIRFEKLVTALAPGRDRSHSPLVQVAFLLQHTPPPRPPAPGLAHAVEVVETGTSKIDLTLIAIDAPGGLRLAAEYRTDLFERATMARLLAAFEALLGGAVEDAGRSIASLPLLSPDDRRRLLGARDATRADFGDPENLHAMIEAQAARAPGEVAVLSDGDALTYAELDRRAGRLAAAIVDAGAAIGEPVGLCVERSPELVVAMLAILKAGGAYVPIDADHPAERAALLVRDAGVRVAVATARTRAALPEAELRIVLAGGAAPDGALASRRVPAESLAYVLYTSGSTGTPKGVMVPHAAAWNFFRAFDHELDAEARGAFLAAARPSFDISVLEILWSLARGLRVVLARAPAPDAALLALVERHGVTHLQCTPSFARALFALPDAARALASVRRMLVGGEAMPPSLAAAIVTALPGRLRNVYGPTETTVWCSWLRVDAPADPIPIGPPIANAAFYVLDARLEPVPLGVPGELCIGGAGVSRGYVARPDLTAASFVPDPFAGRAGARMYRTGDVVRLRADGTAEFCGRRDHQIKLRGVRIELGEIEAAIERHPGVRAAAAALRPGRRGEPAIVAYVVARDGADLALDPLRSFLSRSLPEAMLPSLVVPLDRLPLSPNGKVDRKALPAVDHEAVGRAAYVEPSTPAERALAAIWSELLDVARVGAGDHFFALGGDSLLALQVVARARARGLGFTVRDLFERPTVRALAAIAGAADERPAPPADRDAPPLEPLERWPLTPWQAWLTETFDVETQVWATNQLWHAPQPITVDLVRACAASLMETHDVFRLRLRREGGAWTQALVADPGEPWVEEIDLRALPEDERRPALLREARRVQARIGIVRGPVIAFVLFRLGDEPADQRLLVSIHHALYDAYSLGLVLAQLLAEYVERAAGRAPRPPWRTASYRQYLRAVDGARAAGVADASRAFWLAEARLPSPPMPVDFPDGVHTDLVSRRLRDEVPPKLFASLRAFVAEHPGTSIHELLLFGVARAYARWTGDRALRMDVEHNGRSGLLPDVDLSRTVAALTLKVPVRLAVRAGDDPRASLRDVQSAYREVMQRALAYGLLRYGADAETRRALAAPGAPRVFFNNRGNALAGARGEGLRGQLEPLVLPREDGAPSIISYDLMIECDGDADGLRVTWVYARTIHAEATIRSLARTTFDEIARLVAACGG